MSDFWLRRAVSEDAAQLSCLLERLGLSFELEAELGAPHSRLMLALKGEQLCGVVLSWRVADEVELLDIGVEPTCQGKGLGARLLQDLVEDSRAEGASSIFLEVRAGNLPALGLYKKAGFVLVGQRRAYYSDGEDALLLSLVLSAD